MDLFDHAAQERMRHEAPLAARLRPRNLDEIVGQEHIIAPGRLLRRAIETDRLFSSIIFFGPPGTGKTTIARVIAQHSQAHFEAISAVLAGVADLRRVIADAGERRKDPRSEHKLHQRRTILCVDEVHRWNKAQQGALLPHVESGLITLIGATTQNPCFEVIDALVSRSRIFQLEPLRQEHLALILERALSDTERGYGSRKVMLDEDARRHLIEISGGDARSLLNALELAVENTPPEPAGEIHITLQIAEESIQRRAIRYDRDGDAHYDTISAFIKSVRGSDPDAALYWLAKMLLAGEEPRFILRRLLILASEDIGLAEPMGLVVASAAAQAFEFVGLPEGVYPIVEATLYLATCPKSNSAGAYFAAQKEIKERGAAALPLHLMESTRATRGLEDAPAPSASGAGYQYPHQFAEHFVPQQYLPTSLIGAVFYQPSDQGYEAHIGERLARWRKAQAAALADQQKSVLGEEDHDAAVADPPRTE